MLAVINWFLPNNTYSVLVKSSQLIEHCYMILAHYWMQYVKKCVIILLPLSVAGNVSWMYWHFNSQIPKWIHVIFLTDFNNDQIIAFKRCMYALSHILLSVIYEQSYLTLTNIFPVFFNYAFQVGPFKYYLNQNVVYCRSI